MGDGSSRIPMFSGEDYLDWSKKMKKHLISKGVWSWVEEGLKKVKPTEEMSRRELEEMRQEMVNDADALSIIRESLLPDILMTVLHAKTAKEAWDTLHQIFMPIKPMVEPSYGSVDRSKMKELSSDESIDNSFYTPSDGGEDDGVIPLSGDKPFFDIALTKSAVKPLCHMEFPSEVNTVLPSNNVKAFVRFFGQVYKIYFYGKRKQKSFGSGWRQLVEDHNLEEGDFLVFEIMNSNEYKLEINLQVLRSTLPPELEQEIETRKLAKKAKVFIDVPNCNTSDEDK